MMKYCNSVFTTTRRKSREVKVGSVGVGGDNPIRVQSMTTSNTRDIEATAEQVIRLADAGCDIVRVTVQGKKEAEACEAIKSLLLKKGYQTPLVADIHFYPPAAIMVADFVDKVRINPGNYLDKRATFKVHEYSDEQYRIEIERLEENFIPLVLKCKNLRKAVRIGTNHGSLSDRIMNRYGDTAFGMVESALEYARVCRKHDFHDIIFSMKASNTQVMIQAYRLLIAEMMKLGWDYPLHLGVTEAGEGEDGRVKSAIGIGSLLLDGLGDTIRVSLTEDPWYEIDPCSRLVALAGRYEGTGTAPFKESFRDITAYKRRTISLSGSSYFHRDGTVAVAFDPLNFEIDTLMPQLGAKKIFNGYQKDLATVEMVKPKRPLTEEAASVLKRAGIGRIGEDVACYTLKDSIPYSHTCEQLEKYQFSGGGGAFIIVCSESPEEWQALKKLAPAAILLAPRSKGRLHYARSFFDWLQQEKIDVPVLLNFQYEGDWDDTVITASAECGSLLCDGLGDGLLLEGSYPIDAIRKLSYNILQGARRRTTKTEFISCPSCGRTLFNLQEVSQKIREKTDHLPGVKIAIMGCIVNGPGEMADADFGYVGSRSNHIDLYVGKTCVEKNIFHTEAVERLIALIKEHGRWVEPEGTEVKKVDL